MDPIMHAAKLECACTRHAGRGRDVLDPGSPGERDTGVGDLHNMLVPTNEISYPTSSVIRLSSSRRDL